jgi:alanyl-tRNA synthetase
MTERLYYTDSMLRTFEATVLASDPVADRHEVLLDRTAFYPTSGGQPFDTGTLGGRQVLDVVDRDDGSIAHVVTGPLAVGSRVAGQIDWARRFDHMQQHTGQHILSAAFDRLHGVRTLSFHLGRETSTIDLGRDMAAGEIAAAARAASDVVWDDRPVTVRTVSEDEASRLPLRKEPVRSGPLRLVEVDGFDLSACGGSHVPRTGMVGIIAVAGWERFKGGTRVAFVCGGRALASHDALRDVVAAVSRTLSVGAAEIPAAIERLQADGRALGKSVEDAGKRLAVYRAAEFRDGAEAIGPWRVVFRDEPDADAAGLKSLAAAIVAVPGFVAILAGAGQPVPVVVARSADVAFDAGRWMKQATSTLGGRGGGRAEQAQGGVRATAAEVFGYARATLLA